MARAVGGNADKSAALRAALMKGGWFAALPEEVRELALERMSMRQLAAGDTLYSQDASADGLYAIASGEIRTVGTSREGHQALLSLLHTGEWTGFIGQIDGKRTQFATTAVTTAEVGFLPAAVVRQIFSGQPGLAALARPVIQLLRFAYSFLIETNGRAPDRIVAQRLMDLSRCVYLPGVAPVEAVQQVSQEDIAAATYLTRPTVNRVLGELAKANVISVGYGQIEVLNVGALDAIANRTDKLVTAPAPKRPRSSRKQLTGASINPSRVRAGLAEAGWLALLPKDLREEMLSRMLIRNYPVGDPVYRQGDDPNGLHGLVSGQLQCLGRGSDGRKLLINLMHGGEWTGFIPVLDGRGHTYDAIATQPSIVATLPTEAVRELFFQSEDRYRLLIAPVVQTLRFVYDFLIEINSRPPKRLIAQRLYDLARVPWLEGAELRNFVESLSQDDVAAATGLSRPTVNKVLNELAAAGAIDTGYGKVRIVDPGLLLSIARTIEK